MQRSLANKVANIVAWLCLLAVPILIFQAIGLVALDNPHFRQLIIRLEYCETIQEGTANPSNSIDECHFGDIRGQLRSGISLYIDMMGNAALVLGGAAVLLLASGLLIRAERRSDE
jgi:hypothetical protein